tara:strand:+ start:2082 stop:2558 length:477 start_codon:yes stop_codon:yes gene_type:complete
MDQAETIKFSELNKDYNLVLSFDEPKEFDGKYGKSICYGATLSGDNVRFYASPGLHQEIQNQGLTKSDRCVVRKIAGDFTYFTVNGINSKHAPKGNSSTSEVAPEPVKAMKIEDIQPQSIISIDALHDKVIKLEEKVQAFQKWYDECQADKDGERIPF